MPYTEPGDAAQPPVFPEGIERAGSFKSPDMLAPAMIPVTAGKNSAKIVQNVSRRSPVRCWQRNWRAGSNRGGQAPDVKDTSDATTVARITILNLDRPARANRDAQTQTARLVTRTPRPADGAGQAEYRHKRLGKANHVHRLPRSPGRAKNRIRSRRQTRRPNCD